VLCQSTEYIQGVHGRKPHPPKASSATVAIVIDCLKSFGSRELMVTDYGPIQLRILQSKPANIRLHGAIIATYILMICPSKEKLA
jgi:hypothetical protein